MVKNKVTNSNNVAPATALTAVEIKIPGHSKYITTPKFNKVTTAEKFNARLKQANSAIKGDTAGFVEKTDLDDKLK